METINEDVNNKNPLSIKDFFKPRKNIEKEKVEIEEKPITVKLNKGTGAGGANTNLNGLAFEDKTSIEPILLNKGFVKKELDKNNSYLEKDNIVYVTQNGLKKYMSKFHNIPEKEIYKKPDEAFIIKTQDDKYIVKILEKKNQNVEGSVEEKLYAGIGIREAYNDMLGEDKFSIEYAYCVSSFLKNKLTSDDYKYKGFNNIFKKYNINVYYGDDPDYFDNISKWIGI